MQTYWHIAESDKDGIPRLRHDDGREKKVVSNARTVVAITTAEDGERILREFARWCVSQVIDLWDAPDVMRRYLETGDESLRAAASVAAWAAAWAASMDAASAAAFKAKLVEMIEPALQTD